MGDYVITGTSGIFFPMGETMFEMAYEPLEVEDAVVEEPDGKIS